MESLAEVYRRLDHVFKAALNLPYPHDLSRVFRLVERLGNPHRAFPAVIVTGSKGKGSTSTFLSYLLQDGNRRIGLFTGPHLHTYRERIRLNGRDIGPADFVTCFEEVNRAMQAAPAPEFISRFEIITAMALLYFARQRVDLAVLEVGMGGRYDAVNVSQDVRLAVFTPIELEHVRNLGPTLFDIVQHKAGIMRPSRPALSAPQSGPVKSWLEAAARAVGAHLGYVEDLWRVADGDLTLEVDRQRLVQRFRARGPEGQTLEIRSGLAGTFQVQNALTALAACTRLQELGLAGPLEVSRLARAELPGRLEVVALNPLTLADAAHTPNAVGELVESLRRLPGRPVWVLGFLRDKQVAAMLERLPLEGAHVFLVDIRSHRTLPSAELAALLDPGPARITAGLELAAAIRAAQATAARSGDYVCITGSLYLAAEARTILGLLEPAVQTEAELIKQLELA